MGESVAAVLATPTYTLRPRQDVSGAHATHCAPCMDRRGRRRHFPHFRSPSGSGQTVREDTSHRIERDS